MLPEEKRKTNMGVGMGILLQLVAGTLKAPLAPFVVLLGLACFIWGCSRYMRGKGHHPAWGLLGLLSIIGLVILIFFPDRHKGG